MGSRFTRGVPQPGLMPVLLKLESPDVRLDDNTSYRVAPDILGALYARIVQVVPVNTSPSLALLGRDRRDVLGRLQAGFQIYTRKQLEHYLGGLVLRRSTAVELYVREMPMGDWPDFTGNTLEASVRLLAQQGRYDDIGIRLKRGAQQYEGRKDKTLDLAFEYEVITGEMLR